MGSKQKILILSEHLEDTEDLKKTYDENGEFQTDLVFKASDALSVLLKNSTNLLVFNLDEFTSLKLKSVLELRNIGVDFPVLTLANKMSEQDHAEVAKVPKALLLGKPYDDEELLTLSTKLASEPDNVIQRRFQRFKTGQTAHLKKPSSRKAVEAQVLNISKSGAKLSLNKKSNINTRDLLKIQFRLNEIEKDYTFFAQVVWSDKSYSDTEQTIGVKYISENAFLKKLAG